MPDARTTICGLPVEIVDELTAERVDFVVCGPASYFPDDVHTTCAACERPIVHRPHVPMVPPKICVECAIRMAQAGEC